MTNLFLSFLTHYVQFEKIIFMPRFKATRGLFWEETCNSEPQSDDESDLATSSPNSLTTPAAACLASYVRFNEQLVRIKRGKFSGIEFRTRNPPVKRTALVNHVPRSLCNYPFRM
ncbi:hypothetical protein AVEN_159878-1 [Araneus ventricosus]|uniref:Uncharacterized protein n=1 Tax=Araneus ventricosus TaxID=182803 RepID=A0A4Y2E3E9_ARAVE|nr:hypothetical protein AVEN_159878-1 [Araneus ventricosus]